MKLPIFVWPAVAALVFFSTAPQSFSQTRADFEAVAKLGEKFNNHLTDFNNFDDNSDDIGQRMDVHGFSDIALDKTRDALSLSEMLLIVSVFSDEPIKLKVQNVVAAHLTRSVIECTNHIRTINRLLPRTKNTAVVVQANKLKDDIREFQAKLQEIVAAMPKKTETETKGASK